MDEITCHSCHSIEELRQYRELFGERLNDTHEVYLSLSPIFDSISKQGYHAAFTPKELLSAHKQGLIDEHVLALGGICRENVDEALSYGFGGVMVLGDAWQTADTPNILTISDHDMSPETLERELRASFYNARVDAVLIRSLSHRDTAEVVVRILTEERRRRILPIVYAPLTNQLSTLNSQLTVLCTLLIPAEENYDQQSLRCHNVLTLSDTHNDCRLWLSDEGREVSVSAQHPTLNSLPEKITRRLAVKESLVTALLHTLEELQERGK